MRLRINTIELIGAERRFSLRPGLNVITGPIASGKTTLLRCMRALLGNKLKNFPREARETISNLAGELLIGDETYDIVRPFVTTANAKVDVAGLNEARRLPALLATEGEQITYANWLSDKLHLPRINVPIAPTQPDSDTSPLSVNDYLLYCHLRQDEIDNSVFGHTDQAKNNKRKFVFEVAYGKYDVEISALQEERRNVYGELRRLRAQARTIEEFVAGTPFENRAAIERVLHETQAALESIGRQERTEADAVTVESQTSKLKSRLIEVEAEIDELQRKIQFERGGMEQKEKLAAQLQAQSVRLTRSIVAGDFLLDFDFISCPRCNSALAPERGNPEDCYLCLQKPTPEISRGDVIKEQDRLERQILETRELVSLHEASIKAIEKKVRELSATQESIAEEIDHRTQSYISKTAERIAQAARERTALQERIKRLNDYLELYKRQDNAVNRIALLESRLTDLDNTIEAARGRESQFNERVQYLEERFREILNRIQVPRYTNPGPTGIDRKTYLPLFDGRRFEELQSQGLQVMVNVAHVLAHQLAALYFDLALPNILLIDGLTGNIGYEGLDLERVEAIYKLLIETADKYGEALQIIVADNSVPSFAKKYLLMEFSDEDKLIPKHLLHESSN